MNTDPVLIVDDDVDMEAVVILDEDDENTHNEKTVGVPSAPTVETIDLDDETPIITGVVTPKSNTTTLAKESEVSFRNNLKNNRLMDKIVTRCINMENATGMPRIVYKTLLPLYRDTNNRFKESDAFRALLKKTYKLLMKDPDHKFLHIKTLCEELKSGGLRRKVPFVTLANNVKNNGSQWEERELTSSSRKINHNNVEDTQVHKLYQNTKKKVCGPASRRKMKRAKMQSRPAKDRIKTRSITNIEKEMMTNIIDLDDSETESVVVDNQKTHDGQNDVIIIEETELSDQRNDKLDTVLHETLEEDSNKENNDENRQSSENEMDYDLLIPTNVCNITVEEAPVEIEVSADLNVNDKNFEMIERLEKQIAYDKKMIDTLEEQEVTSENPQHSPYYLCSKLKENIVKCYKKICKLKGDCKDLVKRREIRMLVAEGHPSGPAKRLEQFLNRTIDATGTVAFPDFSDVVKCVVDSNLLDNLAWNRQQVIQEAVALFRQCGQALRKRRQKREYKDLLSLIGDKEEPDDPAEKDPVLLAKLEENKLIAKIKEEEILDRYVAMENNTLSKKFGTPHVARTAEFESDKDSSDSESEENIAIPNIITSSTNNNQPETGESSRSNVNLGLLQTNNIVLTPTLSNNHCGITNSSKANDMLVNNYIVTSTAATSMLNPMLMNLLVIPPTPLYIVQNTITNENQCAIRESSIMYDAHNNNNLVVLPTITTNSTPSTMYNERETLKCSDKEESLNSKLNTTVSETIVGSNNAIINGNSDISSINTTNIRNEEREVINEPCNVTDVQNKDGVQENCDPSSKEVKTENIVKREPLDIQSMLDELEDGFVCQVFDVEDPFLVIEISSDGFTDDEDL